MRKKANKREANNKFHEGDHKKVKPAQDTKCDQPWSAILSDVSHLRPCTLDYSDTNEVFDELL